MTKEELAGYLKEGHFSPGSMLPKVEAALQFLHNNEKRAVITSLNKIESAVKGKAGTEILYRAPGKVQKL